MSIKELRWSSPQTMMKPRFLVLALIWSSTIAILTTATNARAADQKKVRDNMVDLNKQALLAYDAKDFDHAKDLLNQAIAEAKQAGLDDDKMTARTYLHLGAVYFTGYKDEATAIQNFTLAKKIRPDIQLTPSIETPELQVVFERATVEPESAPAAEPDRTLAAPLAGPPTTASESGPEPNLPSRITSPLMCSTPLESPPDQEMTVRCAVKPGLSVRAVDLHYRAPGAESYQDQPMHRTAKGWYVATVPAHVMRGHSLQVYYDARDGRDKPVASNGQIDSPSVVEIRRRGLAGGGDEGDPLANIKRQQRLERYEAGLHRRREGAFYVAPGGGLGWGFAPAGNLEWEQNIKVSAITTSTGLFHVLLEAGYMLRDDLALSLQGRLEYIRQDQLAGEASARSGNPTTYAPSLCLRGQWFYDLTEDGNLQFATGPLAGGGYIRFPVKPVPPASGSSLSQTVVKTDTRPMGVVLVGGSAGLAYHLSRYLSLTLDGRGYLGFPDFGFAVEGDVGFLVAFGGKGAAGEEGEGGGEGEASGGRDEPSSSDPDGSVEE